MQINPMFTLYTFKSGSWPQAVKTHYKNIKVLQTNHTLYFKYSEIQ